ncbi:unnamed protein product [Mytilus coruscus]|uniref:SWIM-type domain-containing protein n=1 Tax=Mytilus coruscus TaxID=42192 RepID=A0A6J7ZXK5_MYTCO|nr:unnamed protein product [Mytilus coruscus]
MSMVKKYLLNCQVSEYNQTSLRQYKLTRAYQHLDAKHLNNVSYNPIVNSDTFGAVKASCLPSQSSEKAKTKYLHIILDQHTSEPYGAFCTCTVGLTQACSHIGALLFLLAEVVSRGRIYQKIRLLQKIYAVGQIRKWGLKHEITASKQVTKLYEATHTNPEIVQPGLLVDRTYSYLRASPDAIMTCDCHDTTVIEIKCPYSCRYLTPTVAVCEKKITYVGIEKENMVLVKGHQYGYYEKIQTQLNVCKENNAKLVVWTTKGLLTIDVPFDEKYWTTIMLPAIRCFFETHIAPEILTGRLKNSLDSQDNVKDKEKSDSSEDSTNESMLKLGFIATKFVLHGVLEVIP